MDQRTFITTGHAAACAPAWAGAAPAARPNLLLPMTDQHRGDWIGADGCAGSANCVPRTILDEPCDDFSSSSR